MRLLPSLLILLFGQPIFAATTYYVRTDGNDTNCNGSANVADSIPVRPNCAEKTIIAGVAHAAGPGDVISIGPGTFTETAAVTVPALGANGNPIIIRGASAATTIYRRVNCTVDDNSCGVVITDKNYIRFTDLTFKDFNGKSAFDVISTSGTHSGIEITNCIIDNVGNRGVLDSGGTDFSKFVHTYGAGNHANYLITGNTFTGVYGVVLHLTHLNTALIDSNTFINNHASQAGSQNGYNFMAKSVQGGNGCNFLTVTNNTVRDMVKDSYIAAAGSVCGQLRNQVCKLSGGIFYFDAGALNSTVQDNFVQNINAANAANVSLAVVLFESGVNNSLAKNNVIINANGDILRAFQNGSYGTQINNNNTFDGNSYYGNGCAFSAMNSTSYVVKNNIFYSTDTSHWIAGETDKSSGGVYQNNLYYNGGGGSINTWNVVNPNSACEAANVSFATWKDASHANSGSTELNTNPLYVSASDLHLQGTSPAINTGVAGIDMGAYPFDSAPDPAVIIVARPIGTLNVGDPANLIWTVNPTFTGNVKIEISHNNAGGYELLVASVAGQDQTYPWTVAFPACSQCFLKITSLSDPSVIGITDSPFVISGQILK